MSDKPIEEKVKDIIVEQLGVNPEQVTPQASFIEDLGADSLDIVELVMAFEEEFNVEVPDEDAEKLQTVGDVVKYIEEKQYTFPVFLDRDKSVAKKLSVSSIPVLFLIDKEGIVRKIWHKVRPDDHANEVLETVEALANAP